MRVIAGTHRRRKLHAPKDAKVSRPITDRVKQALFDRLYMAGLLDGGNALDIFAGVGSLGIEALSRGIDHCTFIERDASIRALLERNLTELELNDRAAVLKVDALSGNWLPLVVKQPVLVAFCDPPYPVTQDEMGMARVMRLIEAMHAVIEPGGAVMLRTDSSIAVEPLPMYREPSNYRYGSMTLHFYQREREDDGESDASASTDEPG